MNAAPPVPTVFIVDDDPSVLRAVGRLVRSAGRKVATFQSARDFLDRYEPNASGCLVLDVTMPELSGLDLQADLIRKGSRLPVIFLTGNGDIPMSVRAMKSGAVNFLSKPCGGTELLAAISEALDQDSQFQAELAEFRALTKLFATLTPREHEVMRGVIAGKLNKQIAADLGTVEKTVKVHRGRVMQKLQVASVPELVRLAERAGVVAQRK